MSHRIIEKRRRDRMNNCLADLSRLIPAVYLKKVAPPLLAAHMERPLARWPAQMCLSLRVPFASSPSP